MRVSLSEGTSLSEQEPSSSQKLCTFVLINLSLFVSYALYTLPGAFLPVYNLDRGIGSACTGLILACVPLCYIIVCPIAGKLLDKYSAKTMLLISTGMLAVVTFLSAALGHVTSNTWFIILIVLLRLIQGANGGVIDVIAFAITAKIYPNNIALTTSIIETSLNLAVAFSPFLGGVFYEAGGFYLSFVVTACAVTVVLIGTVFGVTNVDTKRDSAGGNLFSVLKEVTIWFPAWHSAACMILFNFYIPILSPYVQAQFGAGPTFAGFALLINTAGICITAPFLGHAMDKFNPYFFMAASAFLLPMAYWFLGPAPFLAGAITASKCQLVVTLAVIGVLVPLGCYPGLLIMFDLYKVKFGKMPQAVKNYITAIYCASFPLGGCIGSAMSGVIAEKLSFSFSTTYISLAFLLQTVLVIWWCVVVRRLKQRRSKETETETSPLLEHN
ncbi:hypothetical protein ACHWQZ_G016516 [Mnemiopsis leidyi]